MSVVVRAQREDFDAGAELRRLDELGGGGVASFTGLVRDDGGLQTLFLEHHPALTLPAMEQVAQEAMRRWPLLGLTAIHRYGALTVGDRIVFVAAASAHRAAALEAAAFLIDWLKTRAPFWKKEVFAGEVGRWVEAKSADDAAAERWQ